MKTLFEITLLGWLIVAICIFGGAILSYLNARLTRGLPRRFRHHRFI